MSAAFEDPGHSTSVASETMRDGVVEVNDTLLHVERRGRGRPVVLIHGAAEDAGLLRGQVESLAMAGYQVLSYDRRGTGHSGRDDWPGGGVPAHTADAAALIRLFAFDQVSVVGIGTGGIVAMDLARRHPELVPRAVAWEPPLTNLVPRCAHELQRVRGAIADFLIRRPGDYCGAQALLLTAWDGSVVTVQEPRYARSRVNAEPMVRDDLQMCAFDLPGAPGRVPIILAGSESPHPWARGALADLAGWSGMSVRRLACSSRPHLHEPHVLTSLVREATDTPQ